MLPEIGWEFFDESYFDNDFDNCKTRLANIKKLEKCCLHFNIFSGNRPCVFPFNYYGVSYEMCTFYQVDNLDNEKVVNILMYLNYCNCIISPCSALVCHKTR